MSIFNYEMSEEKKPSKKLQNFSHFNFHVTCVLCCYELHCFPSSRERERERGKKYLEAAFNNF